MKKVNKMNFLFRRNKQVAIIIRTHYLNGSLQ